MRLIDADRFKSMLNQKNIGGIIMAKVIDMVPTVDPKPQWILVSEILPEDYTMMLVTCRTKKGALSVNRAYYSNGSWHGSGSMSGVIAWMPLPKPYDPEEDKP